MVKDLGSSEVSFEDAGMGDLFRCDRHADISPKHGREM